MPVTTEMILQWRSSHASDKGNDSPVAILPGAWRYRVNTGSGWAGVSILRLGKIGCYESAQTIVRAATLR